MVGKPTSNTPQAKQQSVAAITRTYEPEEFEAGTDEDRPVAVLAAKRRQFLSMLKKRGPEAEHDEKPSPR